MLSQSQFGDNHDDILLSWLHIYYSHLASVRSEHSFCRKSSINTHATLFFSFWNTLLFTGTGNIYPYVMCSSTWLAKKPLRLITRREIVFMIAYVLRLSCFCKSWAFCVLWITYGYLHYVPCSACWAFFGTMELTMCNCTSCAQVHELPQSHCGDNPEGTLLS